MQSDQSEYQLNSLLDVLSEQLLIYKQLLELADKEKIAVTASKLDLLNDITTEKTYFIHKLSELENRRMELMTGLAVNFNCNRDSFTLKHLAGCVEQKSANKLLKLRADLSELLKKLQNVNNANKNLMTHCISLMDNSINMLNSMSRQEVTYVQTGHFSQTKENGVLFTGKI